MPTSRREHFYSLYGKVLQSDQPLNLSDSAQRCADLSVGHSSESLNPGLPLQISSGGTRWVLLEDQSLFLQWPGIFEFKISGDGHLIVARHLREPDAAEFETLLLGPVISFALLKLGVEQIHATAVVIDGEAVAFVGESAFGKSTLAASFVRAGFRLLTDDLLVITPAEGRLWAHPGPKRIKLFPETAREVFGVQTSGLPQTLLTPKFLIPLHSDQFQCCAAALKRIYVLNSPESKSSSMILIRRTSQKNACLYMLRNTYNTVLVDASRILPPLTLAASVASHVPTKTLSYARQYASLARVRDAILADLAH